MAVRRSSEAITKHTLNLFEGDYARLQVLFPELGAGRVIRELVRAKLDEISTAAGTKEQWPTSPNFTLEILSPSPEKTSE